MTSLHDTNHTDTSTTPTVSDELFLSECFKHIQGVPTIQIDSVAEACGMNSISSAVDRLLKISAKYRIGTTVAGGPSRMVKLNSTAIATGSPATSSDRITKYPTPNSTRTNVARIVKNSAPGIWSETLQETLARAKKDEATQEGVLCAVAEDLDSASEITYCSTTEKEESVPVDENNRMFPGVPLDRLDDMGLTSAYLLAVKKARRLGTMAELMADETPEEVAKILAAEELLKRAEILAAEEKLKKAEESK